jgi:hypothetical protein
MLRGDFYHRDVEVAGGGQSTLHRFPSRAAFFVRQGRLY